MSERVDSLDHLQPEEVAAYVAGAVSPAVRARCEEHLAGCSECTREVVAIGRLSPASHRPRLMVLAGMAAAAVAVIWLSIERPHGAPVQDERGPAGPSSLVLPVLQPLEDAMLDDGGSFVWSPDSGAITYRLTVTDSSGGEVLSVTTSDTSVAQAAEPPLVPGRTYFWYVDALRKDGGSATTGVHRFRTRP